MKKYYAALLVAGALFAVSSSLVSCGDKDEKLDNDDKKSTATTNTTAAPAEQPLEISLAADNVAKGNETYQKTCAPCHGPKGKGDGPASVALNPKPRDHSNGAYMDKLSNRHIYNVIKNGGAQYGYPTMPGQPQLQDDQVSSVIAFVRSLSTTYKQ